MSAGPFGPASLIGRSTNWWPGCRRFDTRWRSGSNNNNNWRGCFSMHGDVLVLWRCCFFSFLLACFGCRGSEWHFLQGLLTCCWSKRSGGKVSIFVCYIAVFWEASTVNFFISNFLARKFSMLVIDVSRVCCLDQMNFTDFQFLQKIMGSLQGLC